MVHYVPPERKGHMRMIRTLAMVLVLLNLPGAVVAQENVVGLSVKLPVSTPLTLQLGQGSTGNPAPEWKTGCTATKFCPNWYFDINCSGNSSCTVGTSSVTCDGVTTNCPPGTCQPIATGCQGGLETEWCMCVWELGNTPQARWHCSQNYCF
jgi:hypothetical protein